MGNANFSKLSPRQKLQKVLLYLFFIIITPFLVLTEIDDIFNTNIIQDLIRPMCVWHGINWFDWAFRIIIAIVILASIYDFAKQIESKKAKIICTAIYICSIIITVVSHIMFKYFPEEVPFDTLYFGIFALVMFFITLLELEILPKKFGKKN